MSIRTFRVIFAAEVEVTLDDALVPDDEWRQFFYPSIRTAADVAEMFAFNYLSNRVRPEKLDGFYGVELAKQATFAHEDWPESQVEEVTK